MPNESQKSVERFRAGEYVEIPISDPQGKWVRYSDYESLASRLAQVENERDSAREMVTLITTAKKKVEDDLELALRPLVEPAIALEDEQP